MNSHNDNPSNKLIQIPFLVGVMITGVLLLAVGLVAQQSGGVASLTQSLNSLLVLDSVHVWWYISRASGLVGYLLFWLSTIWGFAIASKILDPFLGRTFTFDFHEHLSLLSIGFVVLHMVVLLLDKVEPLSLVEILVPFASAYRPFWTGIGIISFYLTILVTVTFYIRSLISSKTFRTIHYLSVAAYFAALFHSLNAGTDSALTWVQWMYAGTSLVTVFFLVYWLVNMFSKRLKKSAA